MRKIFYGESLCIVLTFLFYIVPLIGTIKNNFNAMYLDVFAPRDTLRDLIISVSTVIRHKRE